MENEHIPADIWASAKRAMIAADAAGDMVTHRFTVAAAELVMAERERCAKLVDCDCNNYCDLKEAAEKIRATPCP